MSELDPLTSPHWQALSRESQLAAQLIGAGVTALGKANYADGKGNYYLAFFGLSIGVERFAKLIIICHYAFQNSGELLTDKEIKSFGHNLEKLLSKVESIGKSILPEQPSIYSSEPICEAIVRCLDSFADAGRGRYANFSKLGDLNLDSEFEPISKWWTGVGSLIIAKHVAGTGKEQKIKSNAKAIGNILGPVSHVLHIDETGKVMNEVEEASLRTGYTSSVQKYGRYYTLIIVKRMAEIFHHLSFEGGYRKNISVLFAHYEHFQSFESDDDFLLNRKVWPL